MSTNKHAQIRYRALDKCFSNFNRRFYMDDLVEVCSEAIYNYAGIIDGVKRRQIFDDIIYMESENGYSIPLDRLKDGKKVYYRYSDIDYSIDNQPINQNEAEQLKATIEMLNRFKGMPQFGWMQEVMTRFEDTFKLKTNTDNTVSFEENQDLKGLNHFSDLFNAIVYKHVLSIDYHPAFGDVKTYKIHPYHLKQYNNRWFLLGLLDGNDFIMTLAIDRIESFSVIDGGYIETDIDFNEYFDDVIGVTVHEGRDVEKIVLKFDIKRLPYIRSKPLHHTQKIKDKDEGIVEIKVIPNKELISLIMSFGEQVEVISPESLRGEIIDKIKELNKKYDLCM